MTFARQVTAMVLLFAWCSAMGHLWTAHPGEGAMGGAHLSQCSQSDQGRGGHHHDGGDGNSDHPGHEPGSHHHHVMGIAARVAAGQERIDVTMPAVAMIWSAVLLAMPSLAPNLEPQPELIHSPPDERDAGWLFVARTA